MRPAPRALPAGTDREPPVNPLLPLAVDQLGLQLRPKKRDGPDATVMYDRCVLLAARGCPGLSWAVLGCHGVSWAVLEHPGFPNVSDERRRRTRPLTAAAMWPNCQPSGRAVRGMKHGESRSEGRLCLHRSIPAPLAMLRMLLAACPAVPLTLRLGRPLALQAGASRAR